MKEKLNHLINEGGKTAKVEGQILEQTLEFGQISKKIDDLLSVKSALEINIQLKEEIETIIKGEADKLSETFNTKIDNMLAKHPSSAGVKVKVE